MSLLDALTLPPRPHRILYFVAEPAYFYSHRLHLALASREAGYTVALSTRAHCHQDLIQKIESLGVQVFGLKHFRRASLNPLNQLPALAELYQIYKNYKPDIVHHVALKPVLYGSFIAKMCGVPKVINALGGLGYLFTGKGFLFKEILKKIIFPFLRWVFSQKNSTLILQNPDDQQTLLDHKLIKPGKTVIIRGAGVDLQKFKIMPFAQTPPIRIVCVSRLLWDKGIAELVHAIEILKNKNHTLQTNDIEVIVYGTTDPENPRSISEQQLQQWENLKLIQWAGHCEDIGTAYATCHIAVLPSYREGLPKSLLEAASCGRPIVTTDVPGCREIVQEGENGFLVPAGDSQALADALAKLIVNADLRAQMGHAGRRRVKQYFSNEIIQQQTLWLYR